MNDDISEIVSKFQDILKEKDIDLGSVKNTKFSDQTIDIDTILKIKEIMSSINNNMNCPRNKLLYSLKPFLENAKQEKLDHYIKIANILSILETQDFGINLKNEKGYDYILIITLFLLIF